LTGTSQAAALAGATLSLVDSELIAFENANLTGTNAYNLTGLARALSGSSGAYHSSACSLNSGAGDGGSQVPSADGKCWLGQFQGIAFAKQFGAVCNGTTDDTPFFTAAGAALSAAGGGNLFIPQNGCKVAVSGNLTIPANVYLVGDASGIGQAASNNYPAAPFTLSSRRATASSPAAIMQGSRASTSSATAWARQRRCAASSPKWGISPGRRSAARVTRISPSTASASMASIRR
jgi:hypothetical protein